MRCKSRERIWELRAWLGGDVLCCTHGINLLVSLLVVCYNLLFNVVIF